MTNQELMPKMKEDMRIANNLPKILALLVCM